MAKTVKLVSNPDFRLSQTAMKEIINEIFINASNQNKFKTVAALFRKHIYKPFTYEQMVKGYYKNMSFAEYASYFIGDGNYYIEKQSDFDNFVKDAKKKGLYNN